MKTHLELAAFFVVVLTVPAVALVACSGDSAPARPNNVVDSGANDAGSLPDTGSTDGGAETGPNACSTGISFDNTRVPGFPNSIPQP